MKNLTVSLGERSYDITVGAGILQDIGPLCRSRKLGKNVLVVTNTTVAPLYLAVVENSLSAAGFAVSVAEIPDGEEFKNLEVLNTLYTRLIECGIDRGGFLIALGGGVVGDLAGFAAASYLRGIDFVQVPTTLLAQVDSSVGGKTGVNHHLGKNLIGAFHQPRLVLIDVETLRTLPQRDYASGLAEVVKYGAVLEGSFFEELEAQVQALVAKDERVLIQAVLRCCSIKASVVEEDEKEQGLRAVLNYGHTLGHAVESLTRYRQYRHGEAVAIGMVQASVISMNKGFCTAAEADRIRQLLSSLGLPVDLPAFSSAEYAGVLARDKKVRESGLVFICNRGIGGHEFLRIADVRELLQMCGMEI